MSGDANSGGSKSAVPGSVSVVDPMSKERNQILAALEQLIGVNGIPIPALLLIIASYAVTFVSTVSSIRVNRQPFWFWSLCWAGAGSKDWMAGEMTHMSCIEYQQTVCDDAINHSAGCWGAGVRMGSRSTRHSVGWRVCYWMITHTVCMSWIATTQR